VRSRRPIPVAAACLTLALPAGAGAATFGSDLSLPVTNTTLTCNNAFPFAANAGSCLAYAVVPSSYAPMSGAVTAVRVKTADVPQGPMQVVVLRSLYQNNLQNPGTPNFFCCFLEEYGPTFTPARNAVTTVQKRLPGRSVLEVNHARVTPRTNDAAVTDAARVTDRRTNPPVRGSVSVASHGAGPAWVARTAR